MSDSTDRKNDPLDNTIEKLETIIDDKEEQISSGSIPVLKESMVPNQAQESVPTAAIPVLDELVNEKSEDVTQSTSTGHPGYTPDQLMQLVDKLENKLNGELEMLINVINGVSTFVFSCGCSKTNFSRGKTFLFFSQLLMQGFQTPHRTPSCCRPRSSLRSA